MAPALGGKTATLREDLTLDGNLRLDAGLTPCDRKLEIYRQPLEEVELDANG